CLPRTESVMRSLLLPSFTQPRSCHYIGAFLKVSWQEQSRQPCSAHVPQDAVTCFRSASRARNRRTPAFDVVSPAVSANVLTGVFSTSTAWRTSAYSGLRVRASRLTHAQISR